MKQTLRLLTIMLCLVAVPAIAAERGYFGFAMSVDGHGFFLNPTLRSVKIGEVVPNSPAAKAGMVSGDLIVEVEGHVVEGAKADTLKPYLRRGVGQSTHLVVKKSDGRLLSVVLTAAPKLDD